MRSHSTCVYRRLRGGKSRRCAVLRIVAGARIRPRLLERSPTPSPPPPVRKPQARARGIRPATPSRSVASPRSPPAFPSLALRASWNQPRRLPSGSPKRERGEYGPPLHPAPWRRHDHHPLSHRLRSGLLGTNRAGSRQEAPSASAGNTARHSIPLRGVATITTRFPIACAPGFLEPTAPAPVRKPQARARGIRPATPSRSVASPRSAPWVGDIVAAAARFWDQLQVIDDWQFDGRVFEQDRQCGS